MAQPHLNSETRLRAFMACRPGHKVYRGHPAKVRSKWTPSGPDRNCGHKGISPKSYYGPAGFDLMAARG